MYSYSTLVNVSPAFRRISLSFVTYGDPIRHFAVVINLAGVQCEINEVQSVVCLHSKPPLRGKGPHRSQVSANRKAELKGSRWSVHGSPRPRVSRFLAREEGLSCSGPNDRGYSRSIQ